MAFKALGIGGLGVNQLVCEGPVNVVAVRAFHFALPDGMVGLAQQLSPDVQMALPAGFLLAFVGEIVGVVFVGAVAQPLKIKSPKIRLKIRLRQ